MDNGPSPLQSIPIGRTERWTLLGELISEWYPPLSSGDGVPEHELAASERRLGFALPTALKEWYSLAGLRNDIWSEQDQFYGLEALEVADGYLYIYIENQGCSAWGIPADKSAQDDPPVFLWMPYRKEEWTIANESTSEFAIQMLVTCIKFSGSCSYHANARCNQENINRIAENYDRLPLPEWHWPATCRFYGIRDLVVEVQENADGDTWIYVSARTATAAEEFNCVLNSEVEFEWCSDDWPHV